MHVPQPRALIFGALMVAISVISTAAPFVTNAQFVATTTLNLAVCGNSLVDAGEQCDVPGETGVYSTSILGRQCKANCTFGPYCGDGILQIAFSEQCDDGNNDSGDFCSETCQVEPAGSGGGGSSGGGSSSRGGDSSDLGETQINIEGRAYPGQTVHIILDGDEVGTVRADSGGRFDFATAASPGTVTMGFWALDADRNRSITFNTTFDVTQGAITNVNGLLLPPTLIASAQNLNPGDLITFSGQAIPDSTVEVHIGDDVIVETTTSDASGFWNLIVNTSSLTSAEYLAKARYILGSSGLTTQSSYSTALQLFVGVDGSPTTPSDLNRDGFVDLIDFSILIFWWQTAGGDSEPPADINGNGNVGLEDFSILLFNWSG